MAVRAAARLPHSKEEKPEGRQDAGATKSKPEMVWDGLILRTWGAALLRPYEE